MRDLLTMGTAAAGLAAGVFFSATASVVAPGAAEAASRPYCTSYARNAVAQQRINLQRRCGYRGSRWTLSFGRHFTWCLRAPQARAANEARGRALALRRCRPRPTACPRIYRPVCGWRGGRWVTFSNSCVARRSGAVRIRNGQCRTQGANCNRYASQAIGIVNAIRRKRCRVPGSYFYSSNRGTQIRVCRGRTPNQRAGVLNSMRGYLQRCQPTGGPGGGNRQAQCNAYANSVMAQLSQWRAKGCPAIANVWNPNRAVHFNLCMSGGQAAMQQHNRIRAQNLRDGCNRN